MSRQGAKRTNSPRFGETAGKPGTAGVAADGFPDRSARALSASVRQPASPGRVVQRTRAREKASIALHNVRGLAVAFVLMVHSSLAYIAYVPAQPFPFDHPPYSWLVIPLLDARRSLGFDVFCAWQDVYLMSLWFFLSGIFTWPSIERDGAPSFLGKRVLRLGAPLVFGVTVLMPVAFYPVYRVMVSEPSLADYARAYLSLPFEPCGPLWFLWVLLAFTVAAVALHRFARGTVLRIGGVSNQFERRPVPAFAAWVLVCAVAYVPLALLFTPWSWVNKGPFALQLCRPLLYAVYYFAGLAVGTVGLGRGMLRADGVAARKWATWLAAAVASLALWLGLTALTPLPGPPAPLILNAAADVTYALAGACSVVFVLGVCLRFGAARRWPVLTKLSDYAFSLYVLHYAPVIWLQYALLGVAWPAPAKAALVFCGTTASCMAAVAAARSLRRSVAERLSLRWVWGS